MNNNFLELFQCPYCFNTLEYVDSIDEWSKQEKDLKCTGCHQLFPIINGIPFFVKLYSTGWIGIEKAYQIWSDSDKSIPFRQFCEFIQKYSDVANGNYDNLITLSHGLSSKSNYEHFLHLCDDPEVKSWEDTQDVIYDWVFNEVLDNLNENDVILDVGVGGATVESFFSDNTNNKIIGMDISYNELFLFSNILPKEQVILTCGDFKKSPIKDNSIDIIISTGGFQHIDHFEEALNEFNRVLKQDGKIVMMAFENLPHDNSKDFLYKEVDVPYDGITLLNRFKEIDFELEKYEENIALHPKYKQYGAVLIKK